jgi:ATP-binding cassette, subfamily B, bacterial PglK
MNNLQADSSLFFLFRRIWGYISRKRKFQFYLLLGLTILSAFAEVISLGAVLPFIAIITQPEELFSSPYMSKLNTIMNFTSSDELIIPLAVAFASAAIFAGILRLAVLWISIRLSNATGADLSIEVYQKTLYQPFLSHLKRSSSEVISGITQKVNAAIGVLLSVTGFITNLVLFLAILCTLILVNPFITFVAAVSFGSSYGLIAIFSDHRFKKNSKSIAREQTKVVKALQEGLGAIRDVLLDGTQKIYTAIYRSAILKLMMANGENRFMNQAPRFAMESLGMVLISIFVLALAQKEGGIASALPLLGMMALGAQRMLPLMQQIYGNWSVVAGSKASLEDVIELLDQPLPIDYKDIEPEPLRFKSSISLRNISFSYGLEHPTILRNLCFEIKQGERIGLIGSTGSGKSTTLDLVMGLLEPTHGSIVVDDILIDSESLKAWRRCVAHVPQTIFLADSSIAENIAFGVPPNQINMDRVRDAANKAMILEFIDSRPLGLDEIVGERGVRLSGGQRQRIGIARALYKQATVIIFDEATSALDNETESEVMQAISNLGSDLTILMVAHRLTTLKNCSKIIELESGCVKRFGSYQEIIGDNS